MERTFSFDDRAMVPTTQGLTSAMPNAGSINTNATRATSGTAARRGAIHADPKDPSKKYAHVRMKYAREREPRKPRRYASVPPNAARNHTSPPNRPVKLLACSTGKFSVSFR